MTPPPDLRAATHRTPTGTATTPQPPGTAASRPAPTPSSAALHALLMAAGAGSRLGGHNKGLLSLHGTPLLHWQLHTLQAAGLPATVVLGHQHAAAAQTLTAPGSPPCARVVVCAHWSLGLAASVLHGIDHLPPAHDALVLLVDMPWLGAHHLRALQQRWATRRPGTQALVPCHQSQRGHPVILSAHWLDLCRTRRLAPRQLMDENPAQVWLDAVDDPAFVRDVDTPADWQACLQALAPAHAAAASGNQRAR